MYADHQWLAEVSVVRPPIGPGLMAEQEYLLSVTSGIGLPLAAVNTAANAIAAHVTGAARGFAETELLRRATGETNDQWWTPPPPPGFAPTPFGGGGPPVTPTPWGAPAAATSGRTGSMWNAIRR